MCWVSFYQQLKEKVRGCLCTNDRDIVLLESCTKGGKYNNLGYLKAKSLCFALLLEGGPTCFGPKSKQHPDRIQQQSISNNMERCMESPREDLVPKESLPVTTGTTNTAMWYPWRMAILRLALLWPFLQSKIADWIKPLLKAWITWEW